MANKKQRDLPTGYLIDGKYEVREKCGSGGASTVYRVVQKGLEVNRALKLLDPSFREVQIDLFEKTFEDEIRLLSALTHRNIVKILDYGSFDYEGKFDRYYIMEFIQGKEKALFSNFAANCSDHLIVFDLIEQIFNAIIYLHKHKILHADIKPANILIQKDAYTDTFEAKLADLGVAKPLEPKELFDPTLFDPPREDTYFWGTKRYSPHYAIKYVCSNQLVIRKEILGLFPHYDLYCFGASLAEIFSSETIYRSPSEDLPMLLGKPNEILRKNISNEDWEYLGYFISILLSEDRNKTYGSAEEAKEAFIRIDPRRSISAKIPEITTIGSKHCIAHFGKLSKFSDRAYSIISHPCFQRLQKLNQLNFVHYIYPDAKHSRFSHSLESFDLAKKVCCHLLNDPNFRLIIRTKDIGLILCSTLLHDIGHYPLAHAIEDLRAVLEPIDNNNRIKADFEMAQYFLRLDYPISKNTLSQIITDLWQISEEEIVRIIDKSLLPEEMTDNEIIIRSIIDSALDVDKLAYLPQDSYYTGVKYGLGIDVDSLISSLTVLAPNKYKINRPCIGITHKGISAAESLISARMHMFSKVYWHHTNRAIMAAIKYVMQKLFTMPSKAYKFETYIFDTLSMGDMEALRYISDLYEDFYKAEMDTMGNPVLGIIDGSRRIPKRLISFSQHPDNPDVLRAYKYLREISSNELEKVKSHIKNLLSKALHKEIKDSEILFDIPKLDKEQDSIPETYVVDMFAHDSIIKLKNISKLVNSIFEDFQSAVKKSRIFIDPIIRDDLRNRKIINNVIKEVSDYIFNQAKRRA